MNKFYAVKKGIKPGIYHSWNEAQPQVKGFKGAIFKSFATQEEAENFMNALSSTFVDKSKLNLDDFDVVVHTDGGCRNHGNKKDDHVHEDDPAAWAYLIEGKQFGAMHDSDGKWGKSNNYMELTAVKKALLRLTNEKLNHLKIVFVCDSKYALRISDASWVKPRLASDLEFPNRNIWQELNDILDKNFDDNITWSWVHGHKGEKGNEFVDHLLNETMDKMEAERDKKDKD